MGEASHPGPPRQVVRRAISVPEEVLDDLETTLTRIDSSGSDDEPLVRPLSGRTSCQGGVWQKVHREETAVGV